MHCVVLGTREAGLLFWLLGNNSSHLECMVWRMLATCLAMQLRLGEPKLASIFLRTQCLSDTRADTGLGQVDLVDRKTKPLL